MIAHSKRGKMGDIEIRHGKLYNVKKGSDSGVNSTMCSWKESIIVVNSNERCRLGLVNSTKHS